MTEESFQSETKHLRKMRQGCKKGKFSKKKVKTFQSMGEKVKIDGKMKALFRKRARDYNSDDDDVDEESIHASNDPHNKEYSKVGPSEGDAIQSFHGENGSSSDDMDDIQPGITRFSEGCRAFRLAFKKIIKKNVSDESLGPVLSGHKKLVVEKLAEEESEHKVKGNAKKEKYLVKEKGHIKPQNILDSHEKFLLSVATKGVVKLFNAVNKAQSLQKRHNSLKFKDEQEIKKQRKKAFFSELGKPPPDLKIDDDGVGPMPAPSYKLTNSRVKDWDKIQSAVAEEEIGKMPALAPSDDD